LQKKLSLISTPSFRSIAISNWIDETSLHAHRMAPALQAQHQTGCLSYETIKRSSARPNKQRNNRSYMPRPKKYRHKPKSEQPPSSQVTAPAGDRPVPGTERTLFKKRPCTPPLAVDGQRPAAGGHTTTRGTATRGKRSRLDNSQELERPTLHVNTKTKQEALIH
jgi:hypothetical protein